MGGRAFTGNFVRDVIVRAIPSGLLVALNILAVQWIGRQFQLTRTEISTLCVLGTAVVAIQVLIAICKPLRAQGWIIVSGVVAIFTLAFAFMQRFFMLRWQPGWPLVATLTFSIGSGLLLRFARIILLNKPWRRFRRVA